jgi:DNA-binding NtrC family response regulator
LLSHFAAAFERELGLRFPGFSIRALRALTEYDWPGNVRQLRNVVEEIFVRLTDHAVGVDDLPVEISGNVPGLVTESHDEKTRILSALSSTRWNKKRAAERLRWSRMTLYRKMALHQIAAAQQVPLKANSAAASL